MKPCAATEPGVPSLFASTRLVRAASVNDARKASPMRDALLDCHDVRGRCGRGGGTLRPERRPEPSGPLGSLPEDHSGD